MSGSYNSGRNGRYPHYYCRGKGCKYIWKTKTKKELEEQFEELLARVKPSNELIDLTKDVLVEEWGNRLEKYSIYKNNAQSEIKNITEEIEDYLKRVGKTKDEVLIGIYEGKIKEIVGKKKELENKLKLNLYTDKDFGTASEKVFNTLKNPLSMWKSDEYNDKRTILFMYFEEKLRYDYYKGFGTAGLAYPIKLISDLEVAKTSSVEMSGCDPESKKANQKLLQA